MKLCHAKNSACINYPSQTQAIQLIVAVCGAAKVILARPGSHAIGVQSNICSAEPTLGKIVIIYPGIRQPQGGFFNLYQWTLSDQL